MESEQPIGNEPDQDALILSEVADLLGRSLKSSVTIPSVLRLLSQLAGLNRGRVVLPDEGAGTLRIEHAYGLRDEEKQQGIYQTGEGITGYVMETGRVCVVEDVDQEPEFRFRAVQRATLPSEVVSFIAVPIMLDDQPAGVLGCHRIRNRPRAFQADIHLLRIVAAMIGQALRVGALIHQHTRHLEQQNEALRSALEQQSSNHGILGNSPMLMEALDEAAGVAASDATVMLQGESGTGKEKFARMIHSHSPRHEGPFICINCAAIPEQLLEAELFGYEKGAFTGAVRSRIGKAEAANGGTLFLDEIGDMTLDLQSKLLRLLQERCIQRIGGNHDINVDIRVITASHRDLQQEVNKGAFRLDLYYRLNVIPLRLPPLRERHGDVALLAQHFLHTFNHRHRRNLTLGAGVKSRLESFPWPGNIRQLENVMERAVLKSRGSLIEASEIEHILREESTVGEFEQKAPIAPSITAAGPEASPPVGRPYQRVTESDPEQLQQVLARCRGNKTQAARELGLSPRQLHYRLEKFGLS